MIKNIIYSLTKTSWTVLNTKLPVWTSLIIIGLVLFVCIPKRSEVYDLTINDNTVKVTADELIRNQAIEIITLKEMHSKLLKEMKAGK